MIVRINQLDPASAEQACGWETGNACGPIERAWSADTFAYQVLILEHDEQHQPVTNAARREQIRQMLPAVIDALSGPDDRTVVRFDGPFANDGVAPAFAFAADLQRCDRFSYSAADHLAGSEDPPVVSIRLFPRSHRLAELCATCPQPVRARIFGLPDELVDPMLDTADLDDERWRDLLPQLSFMVSSAADWLSLLIWTSKFDADETRRRITQRLGGNEGANGNLASAGRK